MRRYTIEVDGRPFEVDVEDAGEQRYAVRVGDRRFEVTLAGVEDLSLAQIMPHIGAPPAPVAPTRPAATLSFGRPPAAPPAAGALGDVLAAPMPGLILRVAVAAGARVRRGQDIVVLEAMKMENVIRAPRDGVIAEVCVAEGQQVGHGAPIVRFEAAGAP